MCESVMHSAILTILVECLPVGQPPVHVCRAFFGEKFPTTHHMLIRSPVRSTLHTPAIGHGRLIQKPTHYILGFKDFESAVGLRRPATFVAHD